MMKSLEKKYFKIGLEFKEQMLKDSAFSKNF